MTLSQAILGTNVTIETVDGQLNIRVAPGTQNGDKFALKQFGVWAFNPPDNYDPKQLRGDHIITFRVLLQTEFTDNQ